MRPVINPAVKIEKPTLSEDQEQTLVMDWLRVHGLTKCFAIMNAGKRSYQTANWAKKMGMRKGVLDIMCPYPRGIWHGLFIEMKKEKGGVLSPEQKAEIEFLQSQCYKVIVAHGADEAIIALKQYFTLD